MKDISNAGNVHEEHIAATVLHVEDVDAMYGRLEAAKPYVPKVPRPYRNDVLDAIDAAQQALLRLVTELIEHG